ncbi:MAG: hypothetical protein ACXWM1_08810, partial [Candidatus Binataceae bacterium]
AGVFDVEKPYYNLDTANLFRLLGAVRHRGAEFSLSGQPIDHLTIVAGLVVMDPRLLGDAAARGHIQVAPSPRFAQFNVQYEAWKGVIFDAQVANDASQATRSDGSIHIPGWTELNIGLRYSFRAFGAGASLRAQAANVLDNRAWGVGPAPSFSLRSPRTFKAILAADFS